MHFFNRNTRLLFITLFSVALLLLAMGTASAHSNTAYHAKVTDAVPKIGSTINTAPTTVTVTTAENMKPGPQSSNLYVYGPSGELINDGDAKVSLNNPKQMSVTIKPEKAGIYVVRWITVSAEDGDPDQGAFVFTVAAQAASSTNTSNTNGPLPWLDIVTGVVSLLIGLGVGIALGRRRTTPASVAANS